MHKLLSKISTVGIIGMAILCIPTLSLALSLPEKTPKTPEEFQEAMQKGTDEAYKSEYGAVPTAQNGLYDPFEKQRNEQKALEPIVNTSSSDSMNYAYIVSAIIILALLGAYVLTKLNKSTNKTTMNKNQRYILAGLVPLIILIAAMGLATEQGNCFSKGCIDAFEWGSTWFIWVIAIGLITIFEYRIFKDRQ